MYLSLFLIAFRILGTMIVVVGMKRQQIGFERAYLPLIIDDQRVSMAVALMMRIVLNIYYHLSQIDRETDCNWYFQLSISEIRLSQR